MTTPKKIIHCDADCFYAAVEIRDDPSLRGLPVAVGGSSKRRGVITTCNYEAREYGVRSAMSAVEALRLCPSLILLPHNMEKYRIASSQMRKIFFEYTDLVEPLSLDEAYLDVSDCIEHSGSATLIAQEIRDKIYKAVGITVSAGVANSKMLAKIASDINKPNGICVIPPANVESFLHTLSVKKLFGVGKVTYKKMLTRGIETCGDLKKISKIELTQQFGKFGEQLYYLSRGTDNRAIKPNRSRKSLSVEHTYSEDIQTLEACNEKLPALYVELKSRINRLDEKYQLVKPFCKIKFNDFTVTTTERAGLKITPDSFKILFQEGWSREKKPARLLGIGVRLITQEDEERTLQLELFEREIK